MFGNKNMLQETQNTQPMVVRLGDGREVSSNCSGIATIFTHGKGAKPVSLSLNSVMYVPQFDSNLLLCAQLARDGYQTEFANTECEILQNGKVVAVAQLTKGLYVLENTSAGSLHMSRKRDTWKSL